MKGEYRCQQSEGYTLNKEISRLDAIIEKYHPTYYRTPFGSVKEPNGWHFVVDEGDYAFWDFLPLPENWREINDEDFEALLLLRRL